MRELRAVATTNRDLPKGEEEDEEEVKWPCFYELRLFLTVDEFRKGNISNLMGKSQTDLVRLNWCH